MPLTCAVLFLVAVVQAVVLSVTHPCLGNTALVAAREVPAVGTRLHGRLGTRVRGARALVLAKSLAVRAAAPRHQARGVVGHRETQLLAPWGHEWDQWGSIMGQILTYLGNK